MQDATFNVDLVLRETFVDRVEHRPTVNSTNDLARELASTTPADETLLVIADEQTAGRGRGSNRWWTGPGALAFSLLVDTSVRGIAREHTGMIALAAALAIIEAIESRLNRGQQAPQQVGLHWPNDVYVESRKLAGILVETLSDGRHIVGIGCNVNNSLSLAPAELAMIVTSLRDLTDADHDLTALLVDLLDCFERRLEQLATASYELGQNSHRRCLQLQRSLTIEVGNERTTGICAGIADDGALLLDTATGPRRFYSGVLIKQQPRY